MVAPLRALVESIQRDPASVAPIVVRHGTHRAASLESTFEVARRLMPAAGITRVAMVTGLDDLGVPVAMAVRPNAWSLAVSQGKGPTPTHARVSALMEAIELHCAERAPPPSLRAAFDELGPRALDPSLLALDPQGLYTSSLPMAWAEATDLFTGDPVLVPHGLVHCDYRPRERGPAAPCFILSSNGLASGNHLAEAIVHGLCELIERDASARAIRDGLEEDGGGRRPVDLDTIPDDELRAIVERILARGAELDVRDLEGPVPCYSCRLVDGGPTDRLGWRGSFMGFGCHLDPVVAVGRAITEAAQSRLTFVSGARDDLLRSVYAQAHSGPATGAPRLDLVDPVDHRDPVDYRDPVDLRSVPSLATDALGGDLRVLLDRLAGMGVNRVAALDLSGALPGVNVTRVIAPGLAFAAEGRMAIPPVPGGAA